ncbi:MAG: ATP-binding cassette domain-containing protein [Parachlamydiaceae bacterium]|nr:ATP-binding cassette domain-containing protein [Parachlamydiaceae bacterium]
MKDSTKPLLQVRDLKKYFPIISGLFRKIVGHVRALDSIDFTLSQSEVLGIVGETGCGKSTLGRTVLRLIEPTAGEIFFDGKNVLSFDRQMLKSFRKEAQIVFQDPFASLNPRKTIGESIGEGLLYHGIAKNRIEEQDLVEQVLLQVGMPMDIAQRYPHQFSGGQQQRICIGRAIALRPKLIVCDEAVSALDVSVQAQILNLLQELKDNLNLSYLFISHDLSIVRHLCDRVIVLYLGKVMEQGSVDAIFNNPKHPYTQALLSAIPKRHPQEIKSRILLKGEIPSAAHPPSGCPFRTRCPFAQPICAEIPPKKMIRDPVSGKEDHEYHCIL